MEALAKRFPAKSIQQLGKKYAEAFEDMLCGETDDEPSRDDATTDWHDWYKLLQRDKNGLVLGPLVETPLFEPPEQLLFKPEDHVEIQESHCKSSRKRKQSWTCEEHRQFLNGVNCLGRGSWKFISKYFVPSRTPAQLASHAQKYFDRIKKNELDDTRQRHSVNDIRLVDHGTNITAHSYTEVGKGKGIASSIPPPILTENIDILHGLAQGMTKFGQASDSQSNLIGQMTHNNQIASSIPPPILTEDIDIMHGLPQGMPEFEQASNSPSKIAEQMTHNNHMLESVQWEVSGTPSPREHESVLLDQTSAQNRACPSWKRSISAATNKRRRNNKTIPPGVLTAQINPPSYEIVPIKRHNLQQIVPPF
uniref:Uncharacterized protein n=1 Tax=Setaria viridis TaxID=4556 RepID=A0A4V6DBU2_SETVI|nr:hypothetical protein SEVIR_2G313200v2 [Setaria viridis]